MSIYRVWSKKYYEDTARYFPRKHEYYGEFNAKNIEDLKKQLVEKKRNPEKCSWERVPPKEW